MKTTIVGILFILFSSACQRPVDVVQVKKDILNTEKDFEKMTREKGIVEAFYFYAADSAVIKRENDSLIIGKESIHHYYKEQGVEKAIVTWTPDFIDVSQDGSMAYTYGKYLWKIPDSDSTFIEYKGVFHTVWKKQSDGSWKYVWD